MPNPLYDALFQPLTGRISPLLLLADGQTISGQAFLAQIARAAAALCGLGLQPGDRVAVQVDKSPSALALYGATLATGTVLLPLNTAYKPEELAYFLADAGARLLICDPSQAAALGVIAAAAGAALLTLDATGHGSFADLAASRPDHFTPVNRSPDDLAALLYTSGTTGRSKGAMLSHRNLLSNAEVIAEAWRFTAQDVLLHVLPIFHTHGLFVACNTVLLTGGSMIFLPTFNSGEVMDLMPKATAMMGVPPHYTRLLDEPRLTRSATAHMRVFISGSAPLLAETHARFAARTGHMILERYGMTETSMNTSNPYDGDRVAGTVGMPLPGIELRIIDPLTDAPVEPGEPGVIELRGPNVFRGYWQMPEKTAAELRPDGFFITGDLGQIDARGYLQIVGRQKDLIISGGYNVYPKELELLLDVQPGVLESAVIGVPHPDLGEAVLAVLVARPGTQIDPEVVAAAIQDRIARFKQPKAMFVAGELPRNAMGKVQKAALRDKHRNTFMP